MARSAFLCVLLALTLPAGCLLTDVSVDETLGVDGGSGSPGIARPPLTPAADTSAGGTSSAGGAGNAGLPSGGAAGSSGSAANPPTQVKDPRTYKPDREMACLDYCTLYTSICADHPANDYYDVFDCTRTCITGPWMVGNLALVEPDSITCRYWHAGLAYDFGVTPHCYHAARIPTQGGCQLPP